MLVKYCMETCSKTYAADILFLLDGSGSIGSVNFQQMGLFVQQIIQSSEVGIDKQ